MFQRSEERDDKLGKEVVTSKNHTINVSTSLAPDGCYTKQENISRLMLLILYLCGCITTENRNLERISQIDTGKTFHMNEKRQVLAGTMKFSFYTIFIQSHKTNQIVQFPHARSTEISFIFSFILEKLRWFGVSDMSGGSNGWMATFIF